MRRSSNDLTFRQAFHLKVRQLPDGRFEASCPSAQGVKPVVSTTRQTALAMMDDRLQQQHAGGDLRNVGEE